MESGISYNSGSSFCGEFLLLGVDATSAFLYRVLNGSQKEQQQVIQISWFYPCYTILLIQFAMSFAS